MSSTTSAPSVALNRRKDLSANPTAAPIWPLNDSAAEQAPLSAKCDRHSMPRDVCCKTLKSDDERTLIDPDVVRDMCVSVTCQLF